MGGSYVRVRRPEKSEARQTRRSPTHSRHKTKRRQILPQLSFSCVPSSTGLRNPIANSSQRRAHIRRRFPALQPACRTPNLPWRGACSPPGGSAAVKPGTGEGPGNELQDEGCFCSPTGASSLAKGQVLQINQTSRLTVRRMAGCYHRNCQPISTRLLSLVVAVPVALVPASRC